MFTHWYWYVGTLLASEECPRREPSHNLRVRPKSLICL